MRKRDTVNRKEQKGVSSYSKQKSQGRSHQPHPHGYGVENASNQQKVTPKTCQKQEVEKHHTRSNGKQKRKQLQTNQNKAFSIFDQSTPHSNAEYASTSPLKRAKYAATNANSKTHTHTTYGRRYTQAARPVSHEYIHTAKRVQAGAQRRGRRGRRSPRVSLSFSRFSMSPALCFTRPKNSAIRGTAARR